MIAEILPGAVVAVEARSDAAGVEPWPEEAASVCNAVEGRRSEFATGRACARQAFELLGVEPQPVPTGDHGEPLWPAGVVGSITHCDGYRACAIASAHDVLSLGIDAEPNAPLPPGVWTDIARPEERSAVSGLAAADPGICWERLLFSAKESVYKAWFPLTQRWLGFEDASVTFDPSGRAFHARLLVPRPAVGGRDLAGFSGMWVVRDGLVATAVAVPQIA
jgi:4'-phosphopantetheinyl transferase EntD